MLGRRPKKSPQAKGQGAAVAKQVRRAKGQGDVAAEQAGKAPVPTALRIASFRPLAAVFLQSLPCVNAIAGLWGKLDCVVPVFIPSS